MKFNDFVLRARHISFYASIFSKRFFFISLNKENKEYIFHRTNFSNFLFLSRRLTGIFISFYPPTINIGTINLAPPFLSISPLSLQISLPLSHLSLVREIFETLIQISKRIESRRKGFETPTQALSHIRSLVQIRAFSIRPTMAAASAPIAMREALTVSSL